MHLVAKEIFEMHLRNGKVLRAPSTSLRTMSELKRASECKFVDVIEKGDPPHPAIQYPIAGQREKLPAPKTAPKFEESTDSEVAKLRIEIELLREQLMLASLNNQSPSITAPRLARHEDGRHMASFLSIFELNCLRGNVPRELWGEHVGNHFIGQALDYYLSMYRMGDDLRQWDTVRERLMERFCQDTRETVMLQLHRLTWRGDPRLYATSFAQAVSRAVSFTPEELVEYFLTRLPVEIHRQLTHNGTIRYRNWEEAAKALKGMEEPWGVILAGRRRLQQSLDDVANRVQYRQSLSGTAGGQQNPPAFRCGECQGLGHRDVNCPLRQPGHTPKRGQTCKRCGGKDHFAQNCSTRVSRPTITATPPAPPANASEKLCMLSSEDSSTNPSEQLFMSSNEEA